MFHVKQRFICLLFQVDGFMNVTMREVQFVDPTGREKKFDHFFVPCRLIRYVQIPTEVDIRGAIKKQFGKIMF
jgi:hypothetical protein